jgi:hypothetical protein
VQRPDQFFTQTIYRGFGEHAAAMEDVAAVLSKKERLTLLRLLKKPGRPTSMKPQVEFIKKAQDLAPKYRTELLKR